MPRISTLELLRRRTLALKILILCLLAALVLSIPAAVHGSGITSTSSATATIAPAAAPTPRNLTLYMHNATIGKDVGGVTTPYIFDTWQAFGRNNTVTKVQEVRQDWYLFPTLAGNLTLNGTIAMHVFVSVNQVGSQITPTLEVDEVNASGGTAWTYVNNFGSVTWWTTPHDLVLSSVPLQHTFLAGSAILIIVKITSGVRTATIWYNASWVPTHVVLQSEDFARAESIAFLDSTGVARASFNPVAANKRIDIVVNVTDPLGGYDVRWVNFTLARPGGGNILTAKPVMKTAGTPTSFRSTFELPWNYTGQPAGRYNGTASVLDNSGYYYFLEFFTTAGFLDQLGSFFYIGGLPHYAWILVVDSRGLPLEPARVSITSGGNPVDSGVTDVRGMVNLTAFNGTYTYVVTWEDVAVAQGVLAVAGNITESSPYRVVAAVYYPAIRAVDASGIPLANAAVYLTYPNGTTAATPLFTNGTGETAIGRLPGGSLEVRILWRGVEVAHLSLTVNGNAPPAITVPSAVYYLTVTVTDSRSVPLADAQVVASDAVYGLVADAEITNASGKIVSRLPRGTYDIGVAWNDVAVNSGDTVILAANGNVTIVANVYYLSVSTVDSRSASVPDVRVVAVAASGRIFTAAGSDANGRAVVRVPATTVRLEAEWLDVPVGAMDVTVTGDAAVTFNLQVYTLQVRVVDANGAALAGPQVSVEANGRIFALETTNGSGLAGTRLPIGTYVVDARLTAEYLYTHVDALGEANADLSQDQTTTIRLGAYPPPVMSTVAFGIGLSLAVVGVGLSFLFYLLGKRRATARKPTEGP